MSLLVRGAYQVVTPTGSGARRGRDLRELEIHEGAVVRCEDDRIVFVGGEDEHHRLFEAPDEVLDADGGCVLPGFVDPHTHPV